MNTRSNRPVRCRRSMIGKTDGGATRSTLLIARVTGRSPLRRPARMVSVSRSMPRRASTTSTRRSASSTLRQAARTMACSRRRPGAGVKMPGVSTNTSCASPRMVIPRTRRRVVWTLDGHDRDLGADQTIEQRRLADVRRAQDRDEAATGRGWLAHGCSDLGRPGAPAAARRRPARRPAWSCRSPSPWRRRRARPRSRRSARGAARTSWSLDRRAGRARGSGSTPEARSWRPAAARACSARRGSQWARMNDLRRPPSRHRDRAHRSAPPGRPRESPDWSGRRPPPRCGRGSSQLADPELCGDLGQGFAPHQAGLPLRQGTLALVGKPVEQQLGDHDIQDPIAQELETLVAALDPPARAGRRCCGSRPRAAALSARTDGRAAARLRPAGDDCQAPARRSVTRSGRTAGGSGSRAASSRPPTPGRCRWSRRR